MTPGQASRPSSTSEKPSSRARSARRSSCYGCSRLRCTWRGRTWSATPASSYLRLGADLWWIIFVALRDIILVQVFLGSFIFFYPDVVKSKELPITGGLAAVCAFAALLIKLMTTGDRDIRGVKAQTLLLGLGSVLYIGPYFLGTQSTELTGQHIEKLVPYLVTSLNPDVALPLCYLSAVLVGILAIVAVGYDLAQTVTRRPTPGMEA